MTRRRLKIDPEDGHLKMDFVCKVTLHLMPEAVLSLSPQGAGLKYQAVNPPSRDPLAVMGRLVKQITQLPHPPWDTPVGDPPVGLSHSCPSKSDHSSVTLLLLSSFPSLTSLPLVVFSWVIFPISYLHRPWPSGLLLAGRCIFLPPFYTCSEGSNLPK